MLHLLCGLGERNASCKIYRWWGQTTVLITDSRGGRGPLPLGVPEQAPLEAPVTSEESFCNLTLHVVALIPLGTHTACCCHCHML